MDMTFEEILKQLHDPAVAIMVAIALVNWTKDQFGVHGRVILLFTFGWAGVLAALQFAGPYAVGPFALADWLYSTAVTGMGAALGWSGVVKPVLHKVRGTEPTRVSASKRVGNPLGALSPRQRREGVQNAS